MTVTDDDTVTVTDDDTVTVTDDDTVTATDDDTVTATDDDTVTAAAGALPWRRRRGQLQVVLVHRPRYDDWSWAKGKLDPGEEWPVAAVREVFEETGLHVRLGRPLPTSRYAVLSGSGHPETGGSQPEDGGSRPQTKEVRYWAAEVVGGDGTLVNEIDEIAWLDVEAATTRLSYDRDRDQLRALVRADRDGTLTTWPLVIVRHAKARPRSRWPDADSLRPLNARGRERAEALVPILASYGVTRVVTSPSVRCLDTVLPYAVAAELKIRLKPGLSEEGFAERPDHAPRHLARLLAHGSATVVSSHGPVLPVLLEHLAGIADSANSGDSRESGASGASGKNSAKVTLAEAARRGMGKGEALVAHLVGTGAQARVVDVELFPAS
ncbi:MAG: NUDIX hydrolase [Dermatophilaceae bacterium]